MSRRRGEDAESGRGDAGDAGDAGEAATPRVRRRPVAGEHAPRLFEDGGATGAHPVPSDAPDPRDDAPGLLAAVDAWRGTHPLARLRESLLAHGREGKLKRRRDVLAEAMIARHLVDRGCEVQFEVPTPGGRTCDFEVRTGEGTFYLHVKRIAGRQRDRTLTISSRLRVLEQIRKPYIVGIRWRPEASDEEMQRLVSEAGRFLGRASIGDEMVVRNERDGHDIGGVRIIAPSTGPRVTLVIGLPGGFTDEVPRVRRLLRRAAKQFMPRATNVILVGTNERSDRDLLREALLGSFEERWDAFPPRGARVALGRADDGFWSGRRHGESRVAGWFPFEPRAALNVELIFRDRPAVVPATRAMLERALLP